MNIVAQMQRPSVAACHTKTSRCPQPRCSFAAKNGRASRSSLRGSSDDSYPSTSTSTGTSPVYTGPSSSAALFAGLGMFLFTELPVSAQMEYQPAYDPKSYWVTFGLFMLTAPGLWSLIKRAPKAKVARKTYEVEGPGIPNAVPIDDRARSIFQYFKKYNYEVKGTGDVITFTGTYAADKGQAAALVFYTFFSLASIALVLSITVPSIGSWWYAMTALSPAAGAYYWSKGTRVEEVQVKMVTSDDDRTTDIIVQGDTEELTRLSKELTLNEKGMIRVKGVLENLGA